MRSRAFIAVVLVGGAASLAGAGACTKSNPIYDETAEAGVTPCTPGERRCRDGAAAVCVPAGDGTQYAVERRCPTGSRCRDGYCVATGEPCKSGCADGQVCTLLLNPGVTGGVGTFCAGPAGSREGGKPCTSGDWCRSGFCLGSGSGARRTCFLACGTWRTCPSGMRCADLDVTVHGLRTRVEGCVNAR